MVATPVESDNVNINIPQLNVEAFSGAMLYVPKAHRADVLALDPATAAAFAAYISHQGPKLLRSDPPAPTPGAENTASSAASTGKEISGLPGSNPTGVTGGAASGGGVGNVPSLPLTDLSAAPLKGSAEFPATELPSDMPAPSSAKSSPNGRIPIDFLTGDADGISWMTPLLLPLVHKRTPHRQVVNVVMQLPLTVPANSDPNVRLARDADIPTLNRWRRQYKEERGILFDADMDAWIQGQRIFVYEHEGQIVAAAKFDLDLQSLTEIGGVYTFPEFRKRGFGNAIVRDLAFRIRQFRKTPTLQVDELNTPALKLYESAGWQTMGKLARVWLTG